MSQDLPYERGDDAAASEPGALLDAAALLGDEPEVGLEASFEQVYAENFEYVFACVRRLGVPPGAIEDAVQDVFVVALRRLEDFEGRSSVRTWLYSIARRVASDVRRGAGRRGRRRAALAREPVGPAVSPQDAVRHREAVAHIEAFLDTLDDARREVFVLAELEGLSGPEIVGRTGAKLNTVYSRLRKAKRAFSNYCEATQAEAERLLNDERDRQAPQGAQRRTWAGLAPWLSSSSTATSLAAQVGLFFATFVLGTGGLWVAKLVTRPGPALAGAAVSASVDPDPARDRVAPRGSAALAIRAVSSPVAALAPRPGTLRTDPTGGDDSTAPSSRERGRSSAGAPDRTPTGSAPMSSSSVAPRGSLRLELDLVARARAADVNVDDAAVLSTAEEFRRGVATGALTGQLAGQVDGYALGARCRSGATNALVAARAWLAAHPNSTLVEHVRARCRILDSMAAEDSSP
jgi:RNA polymerase sigma-70 factor (ECF subfamily)